MKTRGRGVQQAAAAAWVLACASAAASAPQDGLYPGTLCVTVASTPTSCGPVEVELSDGSQAFVRVSDISYHLWLYPSRLSAVLMHGSMQIHEFESAYAWQGATLQFADAPKSARYELKLGERKP